MTSSFFFWLLVWAIAAPSAYVLIRRGCRGDAGGGSGVSGGSWTQWDRVVWLTFSVLYGPLLLAIVLLVGLGIKIASTSWAQREVRW